MESERWQTIERLYHAALEQAEARRSAFLRHACAGDESLQREVESLLEQQEKNDSFLEAPALVAAAKIVAQEQAADAGNAREALVGTTISHYHVEGKLGDGGMGVVYKARDTRLGRFVALKFLPEALADDAERMARFQREAKILASLNHPNIATIHGLEESGNVRALAMELVEGPTLAERIAGAGHAASRAVLPAQAGSQHVPAVDPRFRGGDDERRGAALPFDEALGIAKQIADALEYAHEHGIIHRDLKPANVKITSEGTVKVLDFGIAKALVSEHPAGDGAETVGDPATPATVSTGPGMILGTPAYMSPEQARGKAVDRRADIWAFGCVLYEMLTGKHAFPGETTGDTLAAVLTKEPDWSALPAATPAPIQRLIRRCLNKEPRQRLQAVGEARIAIEGTISGTADVAAGFSPASGNAAVRGGATSDSSDSRIVASLARRHKRALAAGIAGFVVVIAAFAYWLAPPLPPPTVSGYVQLTHDGLPKFLVGTDGARLYLSEMGPGWIFRIAEVSVSGGTVAPIPAPSLPTRLLNVSPNGSALLLGWAGLAASAEGPLWALPILGGPPRRLANTVGHDGAWSPDGKRLVYAEGAALYLANADGTEPRQLVSLPARAGWPAWSPDGNEICVNLRNPKTQLSFIWEISSEGKNPHPMFPGWHARTGECCGEWMPDGKYFVFDSQEQIWARREAGSFLRKVSLAPVQLTAGTNSYTYPVPSRDGKELFAVAGFRRGELERYDARTKTFEPYSGGISAQGLAFSKDGKWVAYVSFPDGTLWRSKVDGSGKLQLSFPPLYPVRPGWSPDGKDIVFHAFPSGKSPRIYLVSAEGGTPQELMPDDPSPQTNPSWSPDGGSLAFSGPLNGPTAIHLFNMKTHQTTTLPGSQGLFAPHWSPDGRTIEAAQSIAGSLMLFDLKTQKWSALGTELAAYPCWSKDSQYVYFLRVVENPALERVRVRDRKVDLVLSLKGFEMAGRHGAWLGLAPDDSPLLLKDTGTHEIVSLKWQEP